MTARFVLDYPDQSVWDAFVTQHAGPDGGLLQSFGWGEVQRAYRRPVRRAALVEGQRLAAGWLLVEHALPLHRRYWYCPRPCVRGDALEELVVATKAAARRAGVVFMRVDAPASTAWAAPGFRPVPGAVQPREELLIDVRKSLDAMLSAMKQKTRYNIRLSHRHGIRVREVAVDSTTFEDFWRLLSATATRQGIRPHPRGYYQEIVRMLPAVHLLVAQGGGVTLACALLAEFNGVLTFLHGGSADTQQELMAPYALHAESIALAQRRNCRAYNFGGVSQTNPAWAGITRFKQGFAPDTAFTRYGGLHELPVRSWEYAAYRMAALVRR
ncbi:MAG: peptidoglycan bridge formation glycyltransferase FemA/FemB family protein [bacterium]|nr:peptidoglycan bridge formation glycyltransferase FemA/FemB family protein [bacterium]